MTSLRHGSREQLVRRERDVVEKAYAQVRSELSQHRRAELQMVIVDPHGCPLCRVSRDGVRGTTVHFDVAVPPPARIETGGAITSW